MKALLLLLNSIMAVLGVSKNGRDNGFKGNYFIETHFSVESLAIEARRLQ